MRIGQLVKWIADADRPQASVAWPDPVHLAPPTLCGRGNPSAAERGGSEGGRGIERERERGWGGRQRRNGDADRENARARARARDRVVGLHHFVYAARPRDGSKAYNPRAEDTSAAAYTSAAAGMFGQLQRCGRPRVGPCPGSHRAPGRSGPCAAGDRRRLQTGRRRRQRGAPCRAGRRGGYRDSDSLARERLRGRGWSVGKADLAEGVVPNVVCVCRCVCVRARVVCAHPALSAPGQPRLS